MDDYSFAAEQMKEIIINDYLRKNPDVKRHEIVTKSVNGRIIVETITNTFNKLSERQKQKGGVSDKEKKLLEHLSQGGDVRYAASLDSLGATRKYAEWLCESSFTPYTEKEHGETTDFLDKREVDAGRRAQELLYVRKKFTDQMSSTSKPSRSLIQTLMMEYIAAVMRQLKVQAQLYGKEIELGDMFSTNVMKFLRDNFDKLGGAPEKVIATIGKAFKILQKGIPQAINVTGNEDHKKIQVLVDRQSQELNVQRQEYQMILQLIAYLEKLLDQMKQPDTLADKPKDDAPRRRMAFHDKKGGRRR
ncbi:MAG: hypothetical protein P9L94_17095 [Candidatus Hinthialibacter antarcticus]|nr:hypothetical protein [Candidatus Hinthialibacter antarcticus]